MCKHTSETGTFLKCLVKIPVNICSVEDKQVSGWVLVCVRGGQAVHGTGLYARDKGLSWACDKLLHDPREGLGFPMPLSLHPHSRFALLLSVVAAPE